MHRLAQAHTQRAAAAAVAAGTAASAARRESIRSALAVSLSHAATGVVCAQSPVRIVSRGKADSPRDFKNLLQKRRGVAVPGRTTGKYRPAPDTTASAAPSAVARDEPDSFIEVADRLSLTDSGDVSRAMDEFERDDAAHSEMVSPQPSDAQRNSKQRSAKQARQEGGRQADEGRILWFSDPHLLRTHLEKLVKLSRSDEAFEILKRHEGAGNEFVYAAFLTALAKSREHKLALDVYKHMRQKKKTVLPGAYVMVLRSIEGQLRDLKRHQEEQRAKLFGLAEDAWSHMERNLVQLNMMLCVCDAAGHDAAWERARSIYFSASKNGDRMLELLAKPVPTTAEEIAKARAEARANEGQAKAAEETRRRVFPDTWTFTIFIGICANRGSAEGFTAGYASWALAQRLERATARREAAERAARQAANLRQGTARPERDLPFDGVRIDSRLVIKFVLLCVRSDDKAHGQLAIDAAHKYFGLPKTHTEGETPAVATRRAGQDRWAEGRHLPLSNATVTLLMHLAQRLRYPALGQRWFDIARQQGVEPDEGCMHAAATVLLSAKQYERAWDMATSPTTRYTYQLGLRTSSLAALDESEARDKWVKRAGTMYQEGSAAVVRQRVQGEDGGRAVIFGFREILNYLQTLVSAKAWAAAGRLVIKEQQALVELPTQQFERMLERHEGASDRHLMHVVEGAGGASVLRPPSRCGRRFLLAALLAAHKYLADPACDAAVWAARLGLDPAELSATESALLDHIGGDLLVRFDEYSAWVMAVMAAGPRAVTA
ncbi:PHO85 cyclin-5 [Polyrhizophydium stewartii]|uniref:PHO85 cyclin-5 n=1 Tax=Polyrhizophydium stewartii TaxID=2732419 RepID=A0ABR4N9D1_9FUNG